MSDFIDALSILILLTSLVLIANKRANSYIRTFRVQSALIALATAVLGIKSIVEDGRVDVIIVCMIIIVLKVIFIPNYLGKTRANVLYTVERDYRFNIPVSIIICCGFVVFSYFSVSAIDGLNTGEMMIHLVNAVSVILIGLFFMISRKNAIGQIIGFLIIENGLFVTALFATEGMPLVVDIGIFVDLLTAVMVLGIMVFRISEKFDSIYINKLNSLKG